MCFVCLSYLLDTIRAGDGDKRGAGIRRAPRTDMMVRDECGCRSRHVMCDGRLDKALRN